MLERLSRVKEWTLSLLRASVHPLDILIYSSLLINLLKDNVQKEIFFVFYSFLLLIVCFGSKQKNNFKSVPLMLIALWGFLSIFIHSFILYPEGSFFMLYKNMYLLSEGFIYLFAGVTIFYVTVNYLRDTRLLYVLLPVVLFPWLKEILTIHPRITLLVAVVISLFIYAILNKKIWIILIMLILASAIFIKYNRHFKFSYNCRNYVNAELIKEIKQHPIVGKGYNRTVKPDNMILNSYQGWLYRHNDFLSIASYLGIPILIFMSLFLILALRITWEALISIFY